MPISKKTLLVERDSIYRELMIAILEKSNFPFLVFDGINLDAHKKESKNEPHHGNTVNELNESINEKIKEIIEKEQVSLVIMDKADALANHDSLLKYVRDTKKIPIIITTDENIDTDFSEIINHKLNLILSKPVKSQELLNVMNRLIYPDAKTWFGLENYLNGASKIFRVSLKRSTQIREAIKTILNKVTEWGFDFKMTFEMDLVWQEMITNAIYHSHGYSEFKKRRIPIELPSPHEVIIRFGHNEHQFGISVRDFQGTLSVEKILGSLNLAINQQKLLERSLETGEDITDEILDRNRGLDIMRRLTGEYYFIIEKGKSTEIIIIYDHNYEKDDPYSSIKIFTLDDYI